MATSRSHSPPGPPMVALPVLIPLTNIEAPRAAGVHYPRTAEAMRWIYRARAERGMEEAFVRAGRRILVDVHVYLAALCAQGAGVSTRLSATHDGSELRRKYPFTVPCPIALTGFESSGAQCRLAHGRPLPSSQYPRL
jgi:hypothetical protein